MQKRTGCIAAFRRWFSRGFDIDKEYIFRSQYFINGYPTKETEFNKDLGEIVHENIEYSFSSDYMHLYVNGREYKAPKNWEDRKAQFNNVQEAFK